MTCSGIPFATVSDCDLLMAARSGVEQAFMELCRRHAPWVKRKIFTIVRNQEDAQDVLQDTLFRAYANLHGFRGGCKFSTWITTIGVNSALMLLRKRRARPEIHADLAGEEDSVSRKVTEHADSSPNPEQVLAMQQTRHVLERELQRLRPALRVLVETYYWNERSMEETAAALGISVPAAKARLLRVRRILRSSLHKSGIFSSLT